MIASVASRLAVLAFLGIAGCSSIGPATVPRDRLDYITSVADSWKEQTLLNIVRLRYADAPSFLDVSSVISGYSLQGQLSAGGQISSDRTTTIPSNSVTLGGNVTYLDRPTISYTPLAGDKFTRSLLRPLPPSAIFQLIQAGYPADAVLQVTTRAINGVYNRSGIGGRSREADPEFYPLLEALRRLQISGAISLRLGRGGSDDTAVLIIAPQHAETVSRDLLYVEKTLNVALGRDDELTIAFGALPHGKTEIAILSRSMLEILVEMGVGVDVPAEHVREGRTSASTRLDTASSPLDRPLVRILSGNSRPDNAFCAVPYRGTWYWIPDDDLASKRVFTFLMLFFSLAESGVPQQAPVLTIPAN
jgi:hypothetical protein